MPLLNFLASSAIGAIARGDVVFHVSHRKGERRTVRRMAHVGLAAADQPTHTLNRPLPVYDMSRVARRTEWGSGDVETDDGTLQSRVDLRGTMTLDDVIRDSIVDEAERFRTRPSSLTGSPNLLWFGSPNTTAHPHYPDLVDGYSFSCATFVHHCYERSLPKGGKLVETAQMPEVDRRTHHRLLVQFEHNVPREAGFKRLYPGYLVAAFEADQFPFAPTDWLLFQDHTRWVLGVGEPDPEPTTAPELATTGC